jgi:hypothetical protein
MPFKIRNGKNSRAKMPFKIRNGKNECSKVTFWQFFGKNAAAKPDLKSKMRKCTCKNAIQDSKWQK